MGAGGGVMGLSEQHRQRIARGVRRHYERQRQASRVRPRDLAQLRGSGTVPARLAGFLEGAEAEAEALLDALGGPERVSPQRRALVEDIARMGLVLRAELARYVQAGDSDAGARVGSLANARRASLVALGLDRAEREVPDLQTYLRQRERDAGEAPARAPQAPQNAAGAPSAGGSEPEAEQAGGEA